MANWITITTATLNEAKVAALIEACSTAALGDDQPDRAPGIIQGVVDEVRLACAKRNRVDSDLTKIPKGLRDLTVDVIIARLKKAIEKALSKDETDALARYDRILAKVVAGDWPIDEVDTPIESPIESPTPSPSFGTRCREFTQGKQNG
jgi:hypothetical protein